MKWGGMKGRWCASSKQCLGRGKRTWGVILDKALRALCNVLWGLEEMKKKVVILPPSSAITLASLWSTWSAQKLPKESKEINMFSSSIPRPLIPPHATSDIPPPPAVLTARSTTTAPKRSRGSSGTGNVSESGCTLSCAERMLCFVL